MCLYLNLSMKRKVSKVNSETSSVELLALLLVAVVFMGFFAMHFVAR